MITLTLPEDTPEGETPPALVLVPTTPEGAARRLNGDAFDDLLIILVYELS